MEVSIYIFVVRRNGVGKTVLEWKLGLLKSFGSFYGCEAWNYLHFSFSGSYSSPVYSLYLALALGNRRRFKAQSWRESRWGEVRWHMISQVKDEEKGKMKREMEIDFDEMGNSFWRMKWMIEIPVRNLTSTCLVSFSSGIWKTGWISIKFRIPHIFYFINMRWDPMKVINNSALSHQRNHIIFPFHIPSRPSHFT